MTPTPAHTYAFVSSHGLSISGLSWDRLVHCTLLPLLSKIIARAKAASSDELVAKKLGTEGGRDVHMMLHHSRDTEAKQWDETWVLGLESICRLFRAFLPQILLRRSFDRGWKSLLSLLQQSLLCLPRSIQEACGS